MDILQAVVLAVIEGVTEFLPISSTGHLILAGQVLGVEQTEFVKSFEIAIQLGAIFAVVWLYKEKLKASVRLLRVLAVSFLPTGIIGVAVYPVIKGFLLESPGIVAAALVMGGAVILWWERGRGGGGMRMEELDYKRAIVVGVVQSLSMIPGVSRALAAILGGMGVGMSRKEATEFSFLLAVPTIAAATGYDLARSGGSFGNGEWGVLLLGMIVAFITAYVCVGWLVKYVREHDLRVFGWYRIGLGLAFGLAVVI